MRYFFIASLTLAVSLLLNKFFIHIAFKFKILDYPSKKRKIHKKAMPLAGGSAIILTFILMSLLVYLLGFFEFIDFSFQQLLAIFLASFILLIAGLLDDKYDFPAKYQIISPIIAILIVLFAGIKINYINNPFSNEILYLDFSYLSYVLSFFWLLGLMYTSKFLDGLDALVSSVVLSSASIILFLIYYLKYFQADLAYLTIIIISAFLGFLYYNFPPAISFLGESGSLFAGFIIGILSILAGSKIATALLVFALPIVDTAWVIIYRFINKKSIFSADKNHLHHRLLALNWSVKEILAFMFISSFLFGLSTLILNTIVKFIIITILFVSFFIFEYIITIKLNKKDL